jgi:CubicO group peptidase (beta-lactamase class C family)
VNRAVALALFAAALLPLGPASAGDEPKAAPRDLASVLAPLVEKHGVPALGGCIVRGEKVVALGAAGVRERGKEEKVTAADRWHLGSCTKAMTATLCAMLVEEGKLRWDSTVGKSFPGVKKIDPKWKGVTLEQLLVQRSGAPSDLSGDGLWGRLWAHRGTPREMRMALVEGVVTKPPLHDPGTKFLYANANFAIAGAMAEQAADREWEALLRARLFEPLGMKSSGYGAPGTTDAVDQPRGHGADGKPVLPGPGADNPAAIGPAGTVHASLEDWARFVSLHLDGARGRPRLLTAASFKKLHEPPPDPKDRYAMGWAVTERPWAGGRVLTHSGSNTMWYCTTWIAPEKGFAVLVTCNQGGDVAAKACDDAAGALIRDYQEHPGPASER